MSLHKAFRVRLSTLYSPPNKKFLKQTEIFVVSGSLRNKWEKLRGGTIAKIYNEVLIIMQFL
jgi:hypothetical protein